MSVNWPKDLVLAVHPIIQGTINCHPMFTFKNLTCPPRCHPEADPRNSSILENWPKDLVLVVHPIIQGIINCHPKFTFKNLTCPPRCHPEADPRNSSILENWPKDLVLAVPFLKLEQPIVRFTQ